MLGRPLQRPLMSSCWSNWFFRGSFAVSNVVGSPPTSSGTSRGFGNGASASS